MPKEEEKGGRRGRRKEEGRRRGRRGGGEGEEVEEEVVLFRRNKIRSRPLKIAVYEDNMMPTGRETSHKKRKTSVAMSLGPFSKKFIMTTKASIRVT